MITLPWDGAGLALLQRYYSVGWLSPRTVPKKLAEAVISNSSNTSNTSNTTTTTIVGTNDTVMAEEGTEAENKDVWMAEHGNGLLMYGLCPQHSLVQALRAGKTRITRAESRIEVEARVGKRKYGGTRVVEGTPLVDLILMNAENGEETRFEVLAPFAAVLVDLNLQTLCDDDGTVLGQEPYGRGWICVLSKCDGVLSKLVKSGHVRSPPPQGRTWP